MKRKEKIEDNCVPDVAIGVGLGVSNEFICFLEHRIDIVEGGEDKQQAVRDMTEGKSVREDRQAVFLHQVVDVLQLQNNLKEDKVDKNSSFKKRPA
jgi:hypothetical protein